MRECWSDRGPVFPGGGGAPRARAVTHGHGPPLVGKQHGLYVVDVGDGEWAPVFLTTTVRPATARGGGEGLTGLPSRSRAQHLVPTLGGRLALVETIDS